MNKKLKAMIVKRFGSQAEFSMAIKEDESTISRVIRGRRQLSYGQMKEWATVLGCDPDDICQLTIKGEEK
jgi:transcriptional regulator with XRE-family HTH domain